MTCIPSANVAGTCACGAHFGDMKNPAHIIERSAPYKIGERFAVRCAACCEVHKPVEAVWQTDAPVTIAGTQGGLFGCATGRDAK